MQTLPSKHAAFVHFIECVFQHHGYSTSYKRPIARWVADVQSAVADHAIDAYKNDQLAEQLVKAICEANLCALEIPGTYNKESVQLFNQIAQSFLYVNNQNVPSFPKYHAKMIVDVITLNSRVE